jgi:FkbM family methyltransferase
MKTVEPQICNIAMEEVGVLHAYLARIAGSKTMIDVGAHHGTAARPFLEDGWRVYGFEPDVRNHSLLAELAREYPLFHMDPRAVSDVAGEGMPFFTSEESTGISTVLPFRESHVKADDVAVTTLEDFFVDHEISQVDFLKIDVEGFDLSVLKGMPWARVRPTAVVCEFEDRKTKALGYTAQDMIQYMQGHGYTVLVSEWHPIETYGLAHRWKRFATPPCKLDDNGWGNLLCFRDDFSRDLFDEALIEFCGGFTRNVERRLISQRKRNALLQEQVIALQSEIDACENSLTWKLTRPLCQGFAWIKALLRSPSSKARCTR